MRGNRWRRACRRRKTHSAKKRLDKVYADYAEPDADFDALAKLSRPELEDIIAAASDSGSDDTWSTRLEVAADALRLPPWDADRHHPVRR